jgi:hypothetical protein
VREKRYYFTENVPLISSSEQGHLSRNPSPIHGDEESHRIRCPGINFVSLGDAYEDLCPPLMFPDDRSIPPPPPGSGTPYELLLRRRVTLQACSHGNGGGGRPTRFHWRRALSRAGWPVSHQPCGSGLRSPEMAEQRRSPGQGSRVGQGYLFARYG